MNQDLGVIFKKLFSFKLKDRQGGPAKMRFGADPYEDWKKVVIVFLILNFLIFLGSGYLFWEINQGNIFEVAPSQSSGADQTTRSNLKTIMVIYDGREKQFETLREAKPVTQDPAL